MAKLFTIRSKSTGEYLAERLFMGTFFTFNISAAYKTKDKNTAIKKKNSQNVYNPNSLEIVEVDIV